MSFLLRQRQRVDDHDVLGVGRPARPGGRGVVGRRARMVVDGQPVDERAGRIAGGRRPGLLHPQVGPGDDRGRGRRRGTVRIGRAGGLRIVHEDRPVGHRRVDEHGDEDRLGLARVEVADLARDDAQLDLGADGRARPADRRHEGRAGGQGVGDHDVHGRGRSAVADRHGVGQLVPGGDRVRAVGLGQGQARHGRQRRPSRWRGCWPCWDRTSCS